MRKFLCKIGFHKWVYNSIKDDRTCSACFKKQKPHTDWYVGTTKWVDISAQKEEISKLDK